MAYNPFDEVIENDPAYRMVNGGETNNPVREIPMAKSPIESNFEPTVGTVAAKDLDAFAGNYMNPIVNTFGDIFAQSIGRVADAMVNEEEALKGRKKFQDNREVLNFLGKVPQQITPQDNELAFKRIGKEYQPLNFKEGFNQGINFFLEDGIKASNAITQEGKRFSELPGQQQFGLSILPFEFMFGLFAPAREVKNASKLVTNFGKRSTVEVMNDPQFRAANPQLVKIIENEMGTFTGGGFQPKGVAFAKEDGCGPIASGRGRQQKSVNEFRKEQTQKLIDIIKQNNPEDDLLTISQMIQKYNLEGLAFTRTGSDATRPPRLKDTVKADIQEQIPELYASKTRSVNQKRLDKAFPIIEKVSKDYPDGFTKPEIISELRKIYPKASDSDLDQIYGGRKEIDGKLSNTFPFQSFMKEGQPISAKMEADKAVARIQQYDEFLKNNPPDGKLSPTKAAEMVGEVVPGGTATRPAKITKYAKDNPDSAIAKFVNDPQLPVEQQLTSDVLTSLKDEFDIFDDFIPIQTASKLTGISETTLGRAVKNGINGVDEFVQPKRSKGKLQSFINSYIPAKSKTSGSPIEQAEALITVDNFRGGMFGPSKESFAKVMGEYGIIPKKIFKDGDFVDNPEYLKGDAVFEKTMADKRAEFFADQISQLDRGQDSFNEIVQLIQKRDAFSDYAKEQFKNLVKTNPQLKQKFMDEYKRVFGQKNAGDFERMLNDFARAFAGNMSHVTPITRFKGRTLTKGDRFKLSPGLKGRFTNPEFYRINLSVDNIARQPRFENIIIDNIKKINKLKTVPRTKRFDVLDKSLDKIARINQEMINNNMSTFLEFSRKDLSPETMRKLIQEGTFNKNALKQSKDKITLFLGKQEDMSLQELKDMFDTRLSKYALAPELFKISKQKPKGAKIDEEMFILGSAPYIVKGFPLDFKKGGVKMAIGGQNFTENMNQQQFTPDPAIEGESAFKQAVESGNLTALNIPKIFKGLGEAFGVFTPNKVKAVSETAEAVNKSDFPLQSFTLEKIQNSQTNQAKPQDWINELQGGKNVAPSSELLDSGLFQYLADYEKYFPNQRISKAKLLQVLEENPISNLKVRIKGEGTGDSAYDSYMGRPRHQNTGSAKIDQAGEDYREVIIEAGTLPGQKSGEEFVNSTHFAEKNVLAFGRVGTYKNSQGDNVAVIQEMQTDYLTKVRNEQERLDAQIKLLTLRGDKAEEKLARATTDYDRQDANNVLAEVQSKLPKLLKLKESNLIKPYPNIAAQELIPTYNKQLQDLQKQINDLSMQGVRRENPEFLMQINRLEGEQKQVLDALLDLNRAGGYELLAKDVKVPDISNRDDLINYSEGLSSYVNMKEVQTFAPTPLNKQTDYVDAIIKAVIKDAENRDINKITIMPADIGPNTRWSKDSEEAKKKFRNLYDKVGVQTLRNIAKKYGGEVNIEQIIDTTKAKKGAKFLNKNVDGEFELLRDLEVRAGLTPEDVDDFLNTEIERIALDYGSNEVVLRREIAPGQTMEYFVQTKTDDGFELIPLREGERAEDATIIIEEYNPSKVDMFVLTLPETNKQAPMYLFKKKKGGIMGDDRLVSITDIYGDY